MDLFREGILEECHQVLGGSKSFRPETRELCYKELSNLGDNVPEQVLRLHSDFSIARKMIMLSGYANSRLTCTYKEL